MPRPSRLRCLALAGLLFTLVAPAAPTAEAAKPARKPDPRARAAAKPAPRLAVKPGETPEMAAWALAATPNEKHAALARLAGSFVVESRFFAGPGAEAKVTQGTSEQTMVLGGRTLRQEFTGALGDQAFQGLGLLGYDNVRQRFYSFWVDGMSTMPLEHEGTCKAPDCKVIELAGEYVDPLSKKKKKSRTTTELLADGRIVFTLYDQDRRGRDFKSLELVYTRK